MLSRKKRDPRHANYWKGRGLKRPWPIAEPERHFKGLIFGIMLDRIVACPSDSYPNGPISADEERHRQATLLLDNDVAEAREHLGKNSKVRTEGMKRLGRDLLWIARNRYGISWQGWWTPLIAEAAMDERNEKLRKRKLRKQRK